MAKSVLKNVIESVVQLSLISRDNLQVRVHSYKDDFDYLWRFEGNKDDGLFGWTQQHNDKELVLIIIWDGIPTENKEERIAEYLTPLDWALAYSYLLIKNANTIDKLPDLRIFILDVPTGNKNKRVFSYSAFQAINSVLPWIQVYSPIVKDPNSNVLIALQLIQSNNDESVRYFRSALPIGLLGIGSLIEDLGSLSTTFSLKSAQNELNDRRESLVTLIEIWRNKLLSPDNRHHIGNIIAPTILSKGLPKKLEQKYFQETQKAFALLSAVRSLVKVLELETQRVSSSSSPVPESGLLNELDEDKRSIFDRRKNINFLLVDDQYDLGFHYILASVLFGANYQTVSGQSVSEFKGDHGKLFCEKNADNLFVTLEQLTSAKKDKEPILLKLPNSTDILLLDLRLWTTESGRKAFFDRLVDICGRINDKNLHDDQMYGRAYSAARSIKSKRGNKGNELEAIALLPLLLSYIDPSLPIILFSSTHQRKVSEMLSHRCNIIADFSKPIFSGYNEEDSSIDLITKLKRSLEKSVILFESRVIWERICARDVTGANLFDWNSAPVFEFLNQGRSEVYNSPETALPNRDFYTVRESKGQSSPKLSHSGLRSTLADIYYKYIVGENFYDFFTILYELIESSLVPDNVLNNPEVKYIGLSLSDQLDIKNNVVRVCAEMRNKKAHGNARFPRNAQEKDSYRLISIVLFLFFLDFVEGRKSPVVDFVSELSSLENKLRKKQSLAKIPSLEPYKLNNNKEVEMLDYFALLACYSANRANDKMNTFLSTETVAAVQGLVKLALSQP